MPRSPSPGSGTSTHRVTAFSTLTWLGIYAGADKRAVIYIDNIRLAVDLTGVPGKPPAAE